MKLDQTGKDFLQNPLFNVTWDRKEYTTASDGSKIKTGVTQRTYFYIKYVEKI